MANYNKEGLPNIPKTRFDLSHGQLSDYEFGKIYPIWTMDAIPGDVVNINHNVLLRFMPTVFPLQHNIWANIYSFFVPHRIVWKHWEKFITRRDENLTTPIYNHLETNKSFDRYSLWDYLGLPTNMTMAQCNELHVTDFARRAYNFIITEYFRNQFVQDPIWDEDDTEKSKNNEIWHANWQSDYFTTATHDRQVGSEVTINSTAKLGATENALNYWLSKPPDTLESVQKSTNPKDNTKYLHSSKDIQAMISSIRTEVGIEIHQLREAVAFQRMKELLIRTGQRYTEVLKAVYDTSPSDGRLNRPELIGGAKMNVMTSEVIQQSQTDTTPLGSIAGHNVLADRGHIGNYRAEEHGTFMSVIIIRPDNMYTNSLERTWTQTTVDDYYNVLYADMPRQEVYNYELHFEDGKENKKVFGYNGKYDEHRQKRNYVTGDMRRSYSKRDKKNKYGLNLCHMAREFENMPKLSDKFLKCNPDWQRVFATMTTTNPIRAYIYNDISALRGIPPINIPAL